MHTHDNHVHLGIVKVTFQWFSALTRRVHIITYCHLLSRCSRLFKTKNKPISKAKLNASFNFNFYGSLRVTYSGLHTFITHKVKKTKVSKPSFIKSQYVMKKMLSTLCLELTSCVIPLPWSNKPTYLRPYNYQLTIFLINGLVKYHTGICESSHDNHQSYTYLFSTNTIMNCSPNFYILKLGYQALNRIPRA